MASAEIAGGVNAAAYYDSIAQPTQWEPAWGDPIQIVAVNIGMNQFYAGAQTLGDLQNTASAALVRSLAWMVTKCEMGTPYEVDGVRQQFYCGENRPRTVQWLEPLHAEVDREVVGYRMWVAVLDHAFNIREGFAKLILQNIEDAQNRANSFGSHHTRQRDDAHMRAFDAAAGGLSGGMTRAPERHIMSDLTLVNSVMALYAGQPVSQGVGNLDEIFSKGVLKSNSAFDPMTVLGPENIFKINMAHVCEAQRTKGNYYDIDTPEAGLSGFRGRFPDGVRASRIFSQYFDPDYLTGSPLPHIAHARMGPIFDKFVEVGQRMGIKEKAHEVAAESLDRDEAQRLSEDLNLMHGRLSHYADELNDEFDAIRRAAPSAAMGTGTLSDSFNSTYVEDLLIGRNDLRKLHETFIGRVQVMRDAFEKEFTRAAENGEPLSDVRVDDKTYEESMSGLRDLMLDQFWRVFRTSSKVTPSIDAARTWFDKIRQDRGHQGYWTRHFAVADNLSPFGNMIARMTIDYGDALEVETNFHLMHLTIFVVLGGARYQFGLHPNMITTGEGGSGKSFSVDQAKKITIPGAILNLTHLTKHGMNTDDDVSDCCFIMEELPLDMIGVDKYGNTTAADPFLKARLTAGVSVTMQMQRPDETTAGQRRSSIHVSRCMCSTIFISNDMLPAKNTAIMQRFIPYVVRNLVRSDTGGRNRTCALDVSSASMLKVFIDEVLHGAQLQHFYTFVWEKGIEAGVLPDIHIETAKVTIDWIFEELSKRNIPRPSRRHVTMIMDLCRVVTMYYGVDMEFFSEFGHYLRAKDTGKMPEGGRPEADDFGSLSQKRYDNAVAEAFRLGNEEPFHPGSLGGLVKWGVVTQEVVVFVLSLMEFLLVPKVRADVAQAASKLAGGGCRIKGTWHGIKGKTKFRKENVESNGMAVPGQHGLDAADGGAGAADGSAGITTDYRYIELVAPTSKSIADRIRNGVENPPSFNDVLSTINSMTAEYIRSTRKEWVSHRRNTGRTDAKGAPIFEMVDILEPVPGAEAELIPCAIVDTLSDRQATGTNRRRLCIAVDVINENYGEALRESIQAALGHKHQQDREFISAFCKTKTINKDKPNEAVEVMHNVFDTVHISPTNRQAYVTNPYGRTQGEVNNLINRGADKMSERQMDSIMRAQAAKFKVVSDLDDSALLEYWAVNGVHPEECGPAYAPFAQEFMRNLRGKFPLVFGEDNKVERYPDNWIAMIEERKKQQAVDVRIAVADGKMAAAEIELQEAKVIMERGDQDVDISKIQAKIVAAEKERDSLSRAIPEYGAGHGSGLGARRHTDGALFDVRQTQITDLRMRGGFGYAEAEEAEAAEAALRDEEEEEGVSDLFNYRARENRRNAALKRPVSQRNHDAANKMLETAVGSYSRAIKRTRL